MRGIKNQKHSQEFVERFHKNLQKLGKGKRNMEFNGGINLKNKHG
ncbi:hypothetical protein [Ornithobacterium rhinotracheale]